MLFSSTAELPPGRCPLDTFLQEVRWRNGMCLSGRLQCLYRLSVNMTWTQCYIFCSARHWSSVSSRAYAILQVETGVGSRISISRSESSFVGPLFLGCQDPKRNGQIT